MYQSVMAQLYETYPIVLYCSLQDRHHWSPNLQLLKFTATNTPRSP